MDLNSWLSILRGKRIVDLRRSRYDYSPHIHLKGGDIERTEGSKKNIVSNM